MHKLIAATCLLAIQLAIATPGLASPTDDVKRIIRLIKHNVDYDFNYTYVPLIVKDDEEESNAFAIGRFVVVRESMLKVLNERELIAVIGHELAHTEKGHLFKRVGRYIGVPVVHFFHSIWLKVTGEPTQDSLDEHREFLREMFEDMDTDMEMQADCFSYQWLRQLEQQGFNVSPDDLISATTKIMGMDFSKYENSEYFEDLPPYQRYKMVKSKAYESLNCDSML